MKVIGIVGGVASGKSEVTRILCELGARQFDADRAGHEALKSTNVKQKIAARWGEQVFGQEGEVDRKRLADIVFGQTPAAERERNYLEQLTHPEITARMESFLEECRQNDCPAVVLDAALLLEAGWDRLCDTIWFVEASRETRLARARERGWSEEEVLGREKAQENLDLKRKAADQIIRNEGSLQRTRVQVTHLWHSLIHPSTSSTDSD